MKKVILNWMEKLGIPTKGFGFDYIKNTGWMTGAKILESFISYIIIILISQFLGAEGLGQYSFLFSFVGLIFIFSDLGISTLLVKDLAKEPKKINKYVSNILSLKIVLSTIILALFLLIIPFIGKENLLISLIIVGIYQFTASIFVIPNNILIIKNKGKIISIANITERILSLIGIIIIFSLGGKLIALVGILLITMVIKIIINYLYAKEYFKYQFSLDFIFLKNILKLSFPFLLIAVFSTIYIQMDTIMLSFIKGDLVVGWYQAGYKLINIIGIFPGILLIFGFPAFARLYHDNKKMTRQLLERILQMGILFIFPAVAGVILLGGRIIEFIYSFQAIEANISFSILIFAEIFIFLTTILGSFIAAVNKQWIFAKIGAVGAIINIILNLLLIPKYSLYGAGIATLITYVVMFTIMTVYTYKKLLHFSFLKYLLAPIIGSGVMYMILRKILISNLIWLIIIGIVIYSITILICYQAKKQISKLIKEKNNYE